MANLKISQLPTAASLTGAELVELVQNGTNVQTTVTGIGTQVASPPIIQGAVQSVLGSLGANMLWLNILPGAGNVIAMYGGNMTGSTQSWGVNVSGGSTMSTQALNGAGTNLANSVQMVVATSAAVANQGCGMIPPLIASTPLFGISGSMVYSLVRGLANGVPVGGFTMTLYFSLRSTVSTQNLFIGFQGAGSSATTTTTLTPSTAFLNAIGLSRDAADTNLQFLISNATAFTKLDLGVTHTSLANQLLRLVITCDGFGNVTLTLTNMESGGLQYSVSYPAATANLPALQAGTGGTMAPLIYMNNGGQAAAVSFGLAYGFFTCGLGT